MKRVNVDKMIKKKNVYNMCMNMHKKMPSYCGHTQKEDTWSRSYDTWNKINEKNLKIIQKMELEEHTRSLTVITPEVK